MNDLETTERRMRAEIEDLKRQVMEQKRLADQPRRPSAITLVLLGLLIVALAVGGFFAGYLPRQRREAALVTEAKADAQALPVVNAARVTRSDGQSRLSLPGSIQAITEGPVLARSTGYLRRRLVDIGDRVAEGQPLAEIEAPELDQQIRQAKASVEQASNAVQQAEAAVKQGRSNENLARVTAQRFRNLFDKGVISRQDNDTYQAQWVAQQANVEALDKAVAAARGNMGAVQANLDRLGQLKTYQTVRAPFAGVITVRNVDEGALVNEGSTLLFRIAQTGRLRTYINLPQTDAAAVRPGQQATVSIADLPGRKFTGLVTRTSNALDPATRTLLTEVQLANPEGALLPGMYAQVELTVPRPQASLLIRGDTLVVRADGPQVAMIGPGGRIHFVHVQLGRDFGDRLEVLSGLEEGQQLVVNPSDAVREGAQVKPVNVERAPAK